MTLMRGLHDLQKIILSMIFTIPVYPKMALVKHLRSLATLYMCQKDQRCWKTLEKMRQSYNSEEQIKSMTFALSSILYPEGLPQFYHWLNTQYDIKLYLSTASHFLFYTNKLRHSEGKTPSPSMLTTTYSLTMTSKFRLSKQTSIRSNMTS